ncbi:MAG: hypothetical protein ACK5HL_03045 [Bacilli bacterium]
MNINQKVKNYKNKNINDASIFLNLSDEIVEEFPYRLNKKTYLLVPNNEKELKEITYEYKLIKQKIIPILLTIKISEIMNKFNTIAQKLGFTVITDIKDYKNDGPIVDLLGRSSKKRGLIEEEISNFSNVLVPLTLSVNEYILNPFFPVIFKNATANRGEDKYLIENQSQLEKIIAVLDLPESKKLNLKNEFVTQEYIAGIEGINSSIRVVTSCTGDILSSLFLMSTNKTSINKTKNFGIDIFNPCEYLNDPNSQYFLNSKNIISNASSGGRVLPLKNDENTISQTDKLILKLHNIDNENIDLPLEIVNQCKEIAPLFGSSKGIVLGIDFIYNSNDNKWYYLETNRNPSVDGYKKYMNLNRFLNIDVKALMQLNSLLKIVEKTMTNKIENKKIRTF